MFPFIALDIIAEDKVGVFQRENVGGEMVGMAVTGKDQKGLSAKVRQSPADIVKEQGDPLELHQKTAVGKECDFHGRLLVISGVSMV